MSWSVSLTGTIDGQDVYLGNWDYTHNTNQMIRAAGFSEWCGSELNGVEMSAEAFATKLADCVTTLESDPHRFRQYDAPNGWGHYDTLVSVLKEMLATAQKFPSAVVTFHF